MTQQNAAMVEESTAASVSLAGEVSRLRQIISEFRLASEGVFTEQRPERVNATHKPVLSPARRMLAKVAGAVGLRHPAQAQTRDAF